MSLFTSLSKLFGTPPAADAPNVAAATDAAVGVTTNEAKAAHVVDKKRSGDPAAASSRAAMQRLQHPSNPARTLSHVFTQLPKNLPNRADIHVDMLEWLMHVALLQTDPVKLHQHVLDIDLFITNVDAKIAYGRLHSRVHLTAFYADVCDKTTEMKMGPGLPTSSTCPTFELEQWKRCHKDFMNLRQTLLRKDANVGVPIQVMARRSSLGSHHKEQQDIAAAEPMAEDGGTGESPAIPLPPLPENAEIDAEVEQHPMMQADYEEVLLLFAVQDAMADLQMALRKIQKDRPRNVASLVKAALQSYHEALKSIFERPPVQLTFTSSLGGQKQSALVSKLSQAIQDVCLNDDNVYSYAQLQQKTRTLLIKWSESILDIPTLFELGYGGVMAPVVEQRDGDDDVSSFGQEEDAPLETQAPDPLPFRRTKYTHSPPKDPAFGSTHDEQVVLEQLSRGSSPLRDEETMLPLPAEDPNGYQSPQKMQFMAAAGDDDGFPMNHEDDDDIPMSQPLTQNVAGAEHGEGTVMEASTGAGSTSRSMEGAIGSKDDRDPQQPGPSSSNPSRRAGSKRKERPEPDLCADSDEESLFNYQPEEKSRRTRVLWTDDETETVVEGVMLFGPGKWAKLKQWAGERLQNRDPVSIKDKWRNIERSTIDASLLSPVA